MDVVVFIPHNVPEAVPLLRACQDGVLLVEFVWVPENEQNVRFIINVDTYYIRVHRGMERHWQAGCRNPQCGGYDEGAAGMNGFRPGLSNAAPVIYFPGALIYSAGFKVNQNLKKKIFLNNSVSIFS
jgi:hypothetical protein